VCGDMTMWSVHTMHCGDVEAGVFNDLTLCLQAGVQESDAVIPGFDTVILESDAVRCAPV